MVTFVEYVYTELHNASRGKRLMGERIILLNHGVYGSSTCRRKLVSILSSHSPSLTHCFTYTTGVYRRVSCYVGGYSNHHASELHRFSVYLSTLLNSLTQAVPPFSPSTLSLYSTLEVTFGEKFAVKKQKWYMMGMLLPEYEGTWHFPFTFVGSGYT